MVPHRPPPEQLSSWLQLHSPNWPSWLRGNLLWLQPVWLETVLLLWVQIMNIDMPALWNQTIAIIKPYLRPG